MCKKTTQVEPFIFFLRKPSLSLAWESPIWLSWPCRKSQASTYLLHPRTAFCIQVLGLKHGSTDLYQPSYNPSLLRILKNHKKEKCLRSHLVGSLMLQESYLKSSWTRREISRSYTGDQHKARGDTLTDIHVVTHSHSPEEKAEPLSRPTFPWVAPGSIRPFYRTHAEFTRHAGMGDTSNRTSQHEHDS